MKIQIKKLDPEAKIPTYAHPGDAGMDMYALKDTTLPGGAQALISTGIAMEIPQGYVGLVWDKSGLSVKQGLKTLAGVIDAGYRGEIAIAISNLRTTPHVFNKGDKIAQMLIQKVEQAEFEEVESLTETSRGDGGFGSTGVR